MTAQELAELRKPKARNDTATCKYVKDELVNGEIAAVYNGHDVTPSGTVDTQVWISGPVRSVINWARAAGPSVVHMAP